MHGGSFNPSRISRKALGQEAGEERVYSRLNKLPLPWGLRPFVERHPEFSWTSLEPKGMLITWAPSSASASGPEQPVASNGATDANAPPPPAPPPAGAPPAEREPPPGTPPSDFPVSVLEFHIGDVVDYIFDGAVTERSSNAGVEATAGGVEATASGVFSWWRTGGDSQRR